MERIAVITGDLINSTAVAEPARFRARLEELLSLIGRRFQALSHQYRGDGFQIIVDETQNPLALALILRTGLVCHSPDSGNRWDARVAVARGPGRLSADDQNGAVYVNSGRRLDAMDKAHLSVHSDSEIGALALGVASEFADTLVNELSPVEAEALHLYLLDRGSHESIARQLGKRRATVTQALNRARYSLLRRYVDDMDRLMRLDQGGGERHD